jgi:hypothetical protein
MSGKRVQHTVLLWIGLVIFGVASRCFREVWGFPDALAIFAALVSTLLFPFVLLVGAVVIVAIVINVVGIPLLVWHCVFVPVLGLERG